eukprot:gene836-10578_t
MDEFEVDILIGADYIWQFMLDHVVRGEHGYGPPVEIPSTNEHSSNIIILHVLKTDSIIVDSDKHLINELHKFLDIESMGIKSKEQELTCSENPLEGRIHFNQKLGKYEISLPFKEDHPVIADNYQVARKRLERLLKRLNSKPDVLHQYNEVISEQLNSGVVERFLENDSEFWPVNEIAPSQQIEINTNVVVTENNDQLNLNKIIPCVNYSSYIRLIRVTAFVLKFVAILKRKVKNLQTDISDDFLSKVNKAKIMWHLEVQKVFDLSRNDKEIRNNPGYFVNKEGIIRLGGRLQNASISHNSKYPVLLPRQHHFTKLVIWHSHLTVKHNGVNETLAQVRSNYWITKGRQIVKSLIAECSKCKTIHGKPYETPTAPPLPAYRVSEDAAFTNVAVDFAGPLYVKDIYTKTDRLNKCYIALFSCANTRAIHLELVPDLFAETFIRALKRFIARRGLSKLIVSDNGKAFLDKNVQMYAQNMNIRWKFNVPTASWWGGWWEICVKLTKKCLRKTLGNAKLSYEELETALIETEGIIYSRPLTGEEISEPPLTPSCLVIGR